MKKFISLVSAMVLCMGLCVPAFALEQVSVDINPNITIVNRSNTITSNEIKELVHDVAVTLVYDDGKVVPVDTVVTIEDAVTPSARSTAGSSDTYQVRATSKIETESDNKNNEDVSASMSVTLRWTDVPGLSNTLDSVQGSLTIDKGTLSNSNYTYGDGTADFSVTVDNGTKTSFYKTVNKTAFKPRCTYVERFKDATFQLNVIVAPTIFD